MTDKKLTIKRIMIFLFFAFVPPFALQLIYAANFGWTIETTYYNLVASVSMLFPAIGNFMARLITKEGMKNSYLKFNLKGNIKYYFIAILVPVFYSLTAAFVMTGVYMPQGSILKILQIKNILHIISYSIYIISLTLFDCVIAFGEEFGWRGYLTPKLEELLSVPAANLLSGIIWGLWHALIVIMGHNFGKDYKFYPYAGILEMCVFCVIMGIFFTALTKKTKSVFPATISHAMNNNYFNIIFIIFAMASDTAQEISIETAFLVICIIVVAASYLLIRKDKKEEC